MFDVLKLTFVTATALSCELIVPLALIVVKRAVVDCRGAGGLGVCQGHRLWPSPAS